MMMIVNIEDSFKELHTNKHSDSNTQKISHNKYFVNMQKKILSLSKK